MARSGRELAGTLQSGTMRATIAVWAGVLVVLAVGSRDLITSGIPAVGELVPFDGSAIDLLREWVSGWRSVGLGSESPAPYRLGALRRPRRPRGRRAGVRSHAAGRCAAAHRRRGCASARRSDRVAPCAARRGDRVRRDPAALQRDRGRPLGRARDVGCDAAAHRAPRARRTPRTVRRRWRAVAPDAAGTRVAIGLLVALVAIVLPSAPLLLVALGLTLALGSLVAGRPAGTWRLLVVAVGGALVALVLHVPWTLRLHRAGLDLGVGGRPARRRTHPATP